MGGAIITPSVAPLVAAIFIATLLRGTTLGAEVPPLTASDQQKLAEMALQWAVDGGIADVKLMKNPSSIVVADLNLPKGTQLSLPANTISLLSLQTIQAQADEHGDFLYFRFGPVVQRDQRVDLPISLVWAVGAKSSIMYMSGGGATLDFERQDGKWILLPVTEHWMS
jgi:hypothetical protein